MALIVGINAGSSDYCDVFPSITTKTTFDCASKVYFDVLYKDLGCPLVPQEPLIVYYQFPGEGVWHELFRLDTCYCYGWVLWKDCYITNGCGYNYRAEYGINKTSFYINPPPCPTPTVTLTIPS